MFNSMQDMVQNLIDMMGVRDANLRRLGVEEFDADNAPTNSLDQGRKN